MRRSLIQILKTAPLLIAIFSLMYNRIKKQIESLLQTNDVHQMQAPPGTQPYQCSCMLNQVTQTATLTLVIMISIILLFGQQMEPPRSFSRHRNSHVNRRKIEK